MNIVGRCKINLHLLRDRSEKLAKCSLLYCLIIGVFMRVGLIGWSFYFYIFLDILGGQMGIFLGISHSIFIYFLGILGGQMGIFLGMFHSIFIYFRYSRRTDRYNVYSLGFFILFLYIFRYSRRTDGYISRSKSINTVRIIGICHSFCGSVCKTMSLFYVNQERRRL